MIKYTLADYDRPTAVSTLPSGLIGTEVEICHLCGDFSTDICTGCDVWVCYSCIHSSRRSDDYLCVDCRGTDPESE